MVTEALVVPRTYTWESLREQSLREIVREAFGMQTGNSTAALDGQTATAGGAQFATFYVDNLFFGIDVLDVQEVLRFQEMSKVPLAPPTIQGLINLRGQIVTAIDMRRRLGLHARPEGDVPMNVVIRAEDGAVSLLVDEIGDVLDVAEEIREPVPENIPAKQRELLAGVAKLDGTSGTKRRLLLILNMQRLLQSEQEDAL